MLRPALAALLVTTSVSHAQDDGGLGAYLELIKPDRLLTRAMQTGILALRTQADIVYEALSVSILAGEASISGVDIWPLPEWDQNVECQVSADRITLSTVPLDDLDRYVLRAVVTGMSATEACLPPDQRALLGMAGLSAIEVPRLTINLAYDIPSSGLTARAHAEVAGLATVDASVDFAYAWLDARDDPDNPVPVLFLSEARVSVENGGGWDALEVMLPAPATDPGNAALVAEGVVGGALADMNASSGGLRGEEDPSLSDAQTAFVEAAAAAWAEFVADPERLVVETTVDFDVYVDIDAYSEDPRALFEDLRPTVVTRAAPARDVLPAGVLRQAYDDPAALSPGERSRVATALLTGVGAPRNVDLGVELISDAANEGDAEAALALAGALETSDPGTAYFYALTASAAKLSGATALLDRLEGALDFADVVDAQSEASGVAELPEDAASDPAAARANALMHLSGRGAIRSYELASIWARLGAAMGDAGSADLLAQIDARTSSAPEAFAEAEARAAEAAAEVWLSRAE